jgi:hypothetical protein
MDGEVCRLSFLGIVLQIVNVDTWYRLSRCETRVLRWGHGFLFARLGRYEIRAW